mmetsp:Transcript_135044/g.328209  ORF Transcript_135044/g.328209 Transcript_135044/m.328209 type:complete len:194 (-) Transcript_135044:181-762(-)
MHQFACRIDFLYRGMKLSNDDEHLLDILIFGGSEFAEIGLVKVKEITFDTLDDGTYNVPAGVQVYSEGSVSYVLFSVRGAHNDAHLGLFPGEVDMRCPFYEFVLDGWGGDMSGIRRGRGHPPMAEAYGAQLDRKRSREFWVSVDSSSGDVAMGVGTDITQKRLMSFTDPAVLTPRGVAVMTKHGASATWTFHT